MYSSVPLPTALKSLAAFLLTSSMHSELVHVCLRVHLWVCVCVATIPLALGTHSASLHTNKLHTNTHTHTLSLSEIMFLPHSAGLFLGQQLQGLLNM